MTTILAFRDTMVADSCVTESGVKYSARKIFPIGLKASMIVGCSGCTIYINEFVRQLRALKPTGAGDFSRLKAPRGINGEDDDGDPEFAGLVICSDGLFSFGVDFDPDQVDGHYLAIGSGRKAALGAVKVMEMLGHCGTVTDPYLAVAAACEVDVYSAGPVHYMMLNDPVLYKV